MPCAPGRASMASFLLYVSLFFSLLSPPARACVAEPIPRWCGRVPIQPSPSWHTQRSSSLCRAAHKGGSLCPECHLWHGRDCGPRDHVHHDAARMRRSYSTVGQPYDACLCLCFVSVFKMCMHLLEARAQHCNSLHCTYHIFMEKGLRWSWTGTMAWLAWLVVHFLFFFPSLCPSCCTHR